jgi:hypothetical protein
MIFAMLAELRGSSVFFFFFFCAGPLSSGGCDSNLSNLVRNFTMAIVSSGGMPLFRSMRD